MENTINLDPLCGRIYDIVERHRLENGGYARWLWDDAKHTRRLGVNEYGCADAANIMYTLGRLPKHGSEARDALVRETLALRHSDGSFSEPTHHPIHTTAHCLAALELFEAVPSYTELEPFIAPYRTNEGIVKLLDSLQWVENGWSESHKGAGMYVIMNLTGAADREWNETYFGWLWDNTDPVYGMSRAGYIGHRADDIGNLEFREPYENAVPVSHHLCGWFHYMFNLEYARMPLRYPEKLIDTCLHLYGNDAMSPSFGKSIGFMEIDWVFALNRATRQTSHRFEESKAALWDFAQKFIAYLESLDCGTHEGLNDLHMLFGAVCALAELQAALPGKIRTTRPMRLVLDRRPFI